MGRHGSSQSQPRGSLYQTTGKFIATCLLALFVAANKTPSISTVETHLDGIAAVVNNTPILLSAVKKKISSEGASIMISPYPAAKDSSLLEQALQDEINTTMILSSAERLGLEASTEEVDQRLTEIKNQNRLSDQMLKTFLRQQGKSMEDYREVLRKQILIGKFRGRVILPQIQLTEKDLLAFYQRKSGEISDQSDVTLRQIRVNHLKSASSSEQLSASKAKEIYEKINTRRKNFLEIEKIYSDDDSGRLNSPPSTYRLKDLRKDFYHALKDLQPGEITQPIKTELGYHIFLLVEKTATNTKDFQEKRTQIETEMRFIEHNRILQKWLKTERVKAQIKIFHPLNISVSE